MPHLSTAERIGRREGRKEGRVEEAQASVLEIIEARMGMVAPLVVSRLTQISDLDRLRNLRKLLLNGASLAEIEPMLG